MFKSAKNKLVKIKVVGIMTSLCNELVNQGDLPAGNYFNLNSQILNSVWQMRDFEFSGGTLNIRPTNETIALFAFSAYIHASITSGNNIELVHQYQYMKNIITKAINANGNPLNISNADYPLIHEALAMTSIDVIDQVIDNSTEHYNYSNNSIEEKLENIDYRIPAFMRNKAK